MVTCDLHGIQHGLRVCPVCDLESRVRSLEGDLARIIKLTDGLRDVQQDTLTTLQNLTSLQAELTENLKKHFER